ncbi:hypothetical protein FKW77_003741 [Venturia effusa]|uniref:Uncharacterized protein n=1 Tax=Venturia effusa TaxID=50376 RepID=A0A517L335_9PEZI|nr:hypothetical protein FKW77_003741 [Venturia effusa]
MAHPPSIHRSNSRRSKLFSKLSRSSSASDLTSQRRSVYAEPAYVDKLNVPVRPHVMPAEPKPHEHYLKLQRDNLEGTLSDIKKVRNLRTSALQVRAMLWAAEDTPPNRKGLPSGKVRIQEEDAEDFKHQIRQILVRCLAERPVEGGEENAQKEKEMEEKALAHFDKLDWSFLNNDSVKGF